MEADGTWQLAPPYDLNYCPGYQGEHFMDVAGEGRTPSRQHVLTAAQAAGLPRGVAQDAIDEVLSRAAPQVLLDFAALVPVRAATLNRVQQAIQTNFDRLA